MNDKRMPSVHLSLPYENENLIVHFVGILNCHEHYELKPHTNPGFEICLVESGKGFFRICDNTYVVETDQLFLTQPNEEHSIWPSNNFPYSIYFICFDIKNSPLPLWQEIYSKLIGISVSVTTADARLIEVFRQIIEETTCKKAYSKNIICSLLEQFVFLLIRSFEETNKKDNAYDLTKRIICLIDKSTSKSYDLQTLSAEVGYSISHICRVFKKNTGFSVMEYHEALRLEKARTELVRGRNTITEIAEQFGFNNIHHFSSAFKKCYGSSPKYYKKNDNNL